MVFQKEGGVVNINIFTNWAIVLMSLGNPDLSSSNGLTVKFEKDWFKVV